jgi:septal ring-binding cell division protein DamX
MNMKIKEILLGLAVLAILAILVKLAFFHQGNSTGAISNETLMKLDSLQKSTTELLVKNAALEEKIRNLEQENTSLELSKETVKNNYTQKKSSYEKLSSGDKETEFKNYIKKANPDFYRKLYGDK